MVIKGQAHKSIFLNNRGISRITYMQWIRTGNQNKQGNKLKDGLLFLGMPEQPREGEVDNLNLTWRKVIFWDLQATAWPASHHHERSVLHNIVARLWRQRLLVTPREVTVGVRRCSGWRDGRSRDSARGGDGNFDGACRAQHLKESQNCDRISIYLSTSPI